MSELCAGRCGLLEYFVEQPSGDDFLRLTVAAKQPTDLDRMGDERRVVDLPVCEGELERGLLDRKPGEPVGGATRSGGQAAEDGHR